MYYDNNWVSYDDSVTFKKRKNYASDHCLHGIMVWAVDLLNTDSNLYGDPRNPNNGGGGGSGGSGDNPNQNGGSINPSRDIIIQSSEALRACYKGFL